MPKMASPNTVLALWSLAAWLSMNGFIIWVRTSLVGSDDHLAKICALGGAGILFAMIFMGFQHARIQKRRITRQDRRRRAVQLARVTKLTDVIPPAVSPQP